MPKRVFRFPADEKGLRTIVEKLVGQPVSYWDDNRLVQGRVVAAEIKRDRYGNPYVEAEVEEAPAGASSP
ncbi:MAG TPA: hypothetical protein VNL95_04755 [Dehalococcoidia bacterium]|nr:hypothetical protein [Dehalococcoidia bacterium]